MAEGIRLQKYLSSSGVASRRQSETLMLQGRVRVNGEVATELGTRVVPGRDRVEVDGKAVEVTETRWLALHKPPGYLSTRRDVRGRRTIYDLLPEEHTGLFYVGRLDRDSEGLLLLTNEGDVAHRLLHPSFGVERVYEVEVAGEVGESVLERLKAGVELEDGLARAHRVERVPARGAAGSRLRLTLREGRKREVRRLMEMVGHPVRRLVRVRYGPIRLGGLARGRWRELSREEIEALERVGRREAKRDSGRGRRGGAASRKKGS